MLPMRYHGCQKNSGWHGIGFLYEVFALGYVPKAGALERCLHNERRCDYGWYQSRDHVMAYFYAKKGMILTEHVYCAVFLFDNSCVNLCKRKQR